MFWGFNLTTRCEELIVSVFRLGDKKFQITKNNYQTNHNDQNPKFQTIGFLILFEIWIL